jgi:hypothetical protein
MMRPSLNRRDLFPVLGILLLLAILVVANRHVFIPPKGTAAASADNVPLPKSWPTTYPRYPHAGYLGSDTQQGQVNGQWYDKAWFETGTDARTVIAWYDARLAAAGYKPIATTETGYSKKYAFAAGKRVVDMEIFIATGHPTDIAVDFLPPRH